MTVSEWKLGGKEYVFNKQGKYRYAAEARQPRAGSKTHRVRIERGPDGSEITILEDGSEAIMFRDGRSFVVALPTGEQFVSGKHRSYAEARAAQGAAYGL